MIRTHRKAVLVTGGAGYIGSHTCKALAQAGYLPVTYDNLVHGHEWAVKWGPLVKADIGDSERVLETLRTYRIDSVIHFAAYAYVGESMRKPGMYFRNNAMNTLTLLEAMQEAGADKIVFSSTCATYGVPSDGPLHEDNGQEPINPYGESKLFVEKMLRWWGHAHNLKSFALRYFNAAGADPDGEIGEDHTPETHLLPLAIQAALGERTHIDVFGTDYPTPDGTAIRDYIHVSDLASAHVQALRRLEDGCASTAVNLGTGRGHSVSDVIAMVERVSGRRVPVVHAPRRAGDPPELVAGVSRAREVLDWYPAASSLQSIVETAWRWHSRHQANVAGGVVSISGIRPVRPAVAAVAAR
jgi:UDP-arabinose 4-epimerase